ncbi:MAG: glucose 1-dehydrogenase [SAR202 cluster bacterium]|nr:2-deoxy-D-gluconate 3-dehydrogenase [Chloroflexota bacterium]MQG50887.1 glucose 1-dehydrogenase [SAR202 cluster bacterium]|tara:strand:- start:7239 stop:8018 length:780 start_codon:yes stop_codon:yes gene_type:complete
MVDQNLDNLFNLSGKVALITGGNKGIGKGIAKGLGVHGAKIIIASRDKIANTKTCEELSSLNIESMSLEIDMTDQSQIAPLVNKIIDTYNQIDVLVNNAGTALRSSPEDINNKDWQYIMDLNLNSVYWLSKEVYPHMKSQGSGKIINIGSMYSIFGSGVVPSYSTTKGGIIQLTKSLAVAWAKENINVNAILPGWITTNLTSGMPNNDPERYRKVSERIALGKWGIPEDLAGTAIFLASNASNYITGASIVVDGGYSVN